VKLLKFPDRTTAIWKMIDSYLRSQSELDDHAIHLLFSANRWELASSIEASLREGTWVVCDRYAFSGVSFSASKGLPLDWCITPDVGLPCPDIVLFLDVSPEVAATRGGYGEERYEKREMQERVRVIFRELAVTMGERWVTINAGQSLAEVTSLIWEKVQPFAAGVTGNVTKLWMDRGG